jgi:hypothetical protein
LLRPAEIAQHAFRVMIHTASLFAIYQRTRDALSELARTGTISGGAGFELLPEITDLLGAPEILEITKKYEM